MSKSCWIGGGVAVAILFGLFGLGNYFDVKGEQARMAKAAPYTMLAQKP